MYRKIGLSKDQIAADSEGKMDFKSANLIYFTGTGGNGPGC